MWPRTTERSGGAAKPEEEKLDMLLVGSGTRDGTRNVYSYYIYATVELVGCCFDV